MLDPKTREEGEGVNENIKNPYGEWKIHRNGRPKRKKEREFYWWFGIWGIVTAQLLILSALNHHLVDTVFFLVLTIIFWTAHGAESARTYDANMRRNCYD